MFRSALKESILTKVMRSTKSLMEKKSNSINQFTEMTFGKWMKI